MVFKTLDNLKTLEIWFPIISQYIWDATDKEIVGGSNEFKLSDYYYLV